MPFNKIFNNIKIHVNNKRNFNKLLKKQEITISKEYLKNKVHQNIFNNLIAIKILLLEKLNYQANFINYKDNSSEKVINKTFQ